MKIRLRIVNFVYDFIRKHISIIPYIYHDMDPDPDPKMVRFLPDPGLKHRFDYSFNSFMILKEDGTCFVFWEKNV